MTDTMDVTDTAGITDTTGITDTAAAGTPLAGHDGYDPLNITAERRRQVAAEWTAIITDCVAGREELEQSIIPECWERHSGRWSAKTDKDFPLGKHSADTHTPFVAWSDASIQSRILSAITDTHDLVSVTPLDTEAVDAAERVRVYINDLFRRRFASNRMFDDYVQRYVVEPYATLCVFWERRVRQVRKYKRSSKGIVGLVTTAYETIRNALVPQKHERVVYEGPSVVPIPAKDFLWAPGATSVDDADWVAQRLYLTANQMLARAKVDGWDEDTVAEMMRGGPEQAVKGEEERNKNEGSGMQEPSQPTHFVIYEIWANYDIDGCGTPENVILYLDAEHSLLPFVRENTSFTGDRPFITTSMNAIAGRIDGQGNPQRLASANDAYDTTNNQFVDYMTVTNCPIVKADPSALIASPDSTTLYSGKVVLVKPGKLNASIEAMQFGTRSPGELLVLLRQQAAVIERLALITEASMGREDNVERPTARGKAMLLQEFAVNFGRVLRNINIAIGEMVDKILNLTYQNMGATLEFVVTGHDGVIERETVRGENGAMVSRARKMELRREDLEYYIDGRMVVRVMASAVSAVKGLEQQNALQLLQLFNGDQSGDIDVAYLKENAVRAIDPRIVDRVVREPMRAKKALLQAQQALEAKAALLEARSRALNARIASAEAAPSMTPEQAPSLAPETAVTQPLMRGGGGV